MPPPPKKKGDLEAISEILATDTDSESGAGASDFENEFVDFKDEQQEQASAQEDKPLAVTSGRASPTWKPPQGTNINIHPFVASAEGVKHSQAQHINKDSSPLCVDAVFHTTFSAAGGTD
jgi:hypothetical protein